MFSFFHTPSRTPIQLFNTQSKQLETLTPLKKDTVSLYTCGPTVYNYAHLGNLRAYVFSDILKRTLLYSGYNVSQVINITDVGHLVSEGDDGEDKVEKATKREGKEAQEITALYTEAFMNDLTELNINTDNTKFPRATDYIAEQIALIDTLEKKGHTYTTSDGVYFDTSTFPTYGALGGIDLDGLKEGARVTKNDEKKHPTDFALWKFSGETKRQQEWESPWGVGFPGWHIECSAMATNILGQQIDIHTGGIDHIPVHHNNEIAQSEAATDKPFAQMWLHNEFLNVESGKMAKSADNFLRLSSLAEHNIHPLAYRYFLLQAQYRSPVTFSWEALTAAQTALERLAHTVQSFPQQGKIEETYQQEFTDYIANDLDTPKALALIWKLLKDDTLRDADKKATILDFDRVLGLSLETFSHETSEQENIPEHVYTLVREREEARKRKDWKEADTLRDKIAEAGYVVKDTDEGPKIEKG